MSIQALEVRMVHSVPEARQLIVEGWEIVSGCKTNEGLQILMKHKIEDYSSSSSV